MRHGCARRAPAASCGQHVSARATVPRSADGRGALFEIVFRCDPEHAPAAHPPADAAEARRRLLDGNRGFVHALDGLEHRSGTVRRVIPFDPRDLGMGRAQNDAPKQEPFAVVLGCSDARVPTELIFNQWCNELFVVRVAGNILGAEMLGSIDYAVRNLATSVKLLVVLAHSGCGAVTAAVDVFLRPATYLDIATSHALRAIVDRLVVVVRGAARALEMAWGEGVARRPGYRAALIEVSVAMNAALSAYTLQQELRQSHGRTGLATVYGVYDLAQRRVHLPGLQHTSNGEPWLADPPADPEDFANLARQLAGSNYVHDLLNGG